LQSILNKGGYVPDSKKIVFLGDSITAEGTFIAYMKDYFIQHLPHKMLEFINLGLSSETVSGLSEPDHPFPRPCVLDRLERALELSKPEWVVVCYGMNDGIYYPLSNERFEAYRKGNLELISKIKAYGSKVIVMTPPPFDSISTQTSNLLPEGMDKYSYLEPYKEYSTVLQKYGEWIKANLVGVADKVIDLYGPLSQFIIEERNQNPSFLYGDGIHPDKEGHWVIAKVLLKGLFTICLERKPSYLTVGDDTVPGAIHSQGESFKGKLSNWKGYRRHDFYLNGREAILIEPKSAAPGNPWIWRTEFFDAFPYADMAMLEKGYCIAYYRISNLYGCPEAVAMMHEFHDYLIDSYGLSKQVVLFGFSRGGLYAFNYAATYSHLVAAIYLDAPVLDLRSWPGGEGEGEGSPGEWEECKVIYGLNDHTLSSFRGSPIHRADEIVKAGIPVIIVAGDADAVVPYKENGAILIEQLKRSGGKIKLILKPGVGHHPHSLEDPKEIVDFILDAVGMMYLGEIC
jgi:lysophospholipase L1-like esterase/pimeloyl-ACP methyl ester carboxylesterase